MILTCPACSARYLIAGDAIGEQGRDVRCGKCGHNWTQEPVHDSLDELSRANPNERQSARFGDLDAAVESFLNDEIPEAVRPLPEAKPQAYAEQISTAKQQIFTAHLKTHRPKILGAMTAVVIFLGLASALYVARDKVMTLAPATKPIFIAMGLEEAGDPRTLVFDSITAKIEGDALTIAGSLINLSSKTQTLLPMVVDILGADGAKLKTISAPIEEKTLKGEESLKLDLIFKDIPQAADQARVRFSEGEEPVEKFTTDEEGADNTHAQPEAATGH